MSKSDRAKTGNAGAGPADVPYTMKLPNGRTLLVLIPGA